MPYTDRLDYMCSITNNWAYALAVEKLAGIQVPERAEYLRVITGELTRLQNHACLIGFLMQDMGSSGTPLMYAFREREKVLDLFESLTGSRMMCNYMRFGGCRVDLPAGWLDQAKKVVADFPRFLDEYEQLLVSNEILMDRTQEVGVLSRELAVSAGISGPMARASGVDYDIRKVDRYSIYDRFTFRVPLGSHGDVYDRFMVRLLEMRESVGILQQAMREIPAGADRRSQDEDSRLPPQAGRGLRKDRSAQGRAWLLSRQRRLAQPLPLSRASAQPHQPDGAGRPLPGAECGGHRGHSG